MADVLSSPSTSPQPHEGHSAPTSESSTAENSSASAVPPRPRERPRPSERIPSFAQNRMSQYSQNRPPSHSRSRPQSTAFPVFQSSLEYATVRDFAYPVFHPMHYGAPPDPPSGATTPGSEWNGSGRRLSDPGEESGHSSSWSAGPWNGDGAIYSDPLETEEGMESLPSTSFGTADENAETADEASGSSSSKSNKKHRKSKSYADFSDYERGRRRESAQNQHYRRSRASGDYAGDMFHFTGGQQSDPAGRDTLRQSRIGQQSTATATEGGRRRDSHFQTMLPNRSFGNTSTSAGPHPQPRLDSDMPLDSEIPTSPSHSPQRQSIGPEDEELYAGQSLALYSFEPENANELRLREGQVILVSYRHGQGWLVAEDPETREQGLVPEEYVRLLSDLPHFDLETGQFREVEEGSELEGAQAEEPEDDATGDGMGGIKEMRVDEAYEESEEPAEPQAKRNEGSER